MWRYDKPYELVTNRRLGVSLVYLGYVYRRKASFRNTVNWVCSKTQSYSGGRSTFCPARCVTNSDGAIKLSRRWHDHTPLYPMRKLHSWTDKNGRPPIFGGGRLSLVKRSESDSCYELTQIINEWKVHITDYRIVVVLINSIEKYLHFNWLLYWTNNIFPQLRSSNCHRVPSLLVIRSANGFQMLRCSTKPTPREVEIWCLITTLIAKRPVSKRPRIGCASRVVQRFGVWHVVWHDWMKAFV